jgi:hypothetical protein
MLGAPPAGPAAVCPPRLSTCERLPCENPHEMYVLDCAQLVYTVRPMIVRCTRPLMSAREIGGVLDVGVHEHGQIVRL